VGFGEAEVVGWGEGVSSSALLLICFVAILILPEDVPDFLVGAALDEDLHRFLLACLGH
jgi:hypothetical protein